MFFFKKRMPEFTKKLFRKCRFVSSQFNFRTKVLENKKFVDQSESFSKNEVDAYQLKKIKEIVSYASKTFLLQNVVELKI